MAELTFTAGQMAVLRRALGVPDGDPDPVADDLLVVLAASVILAEAAARWDGLGGRPDGQLSATERCPDPAGGCSPRSGRVSR